MLQFTILYADVNVVKIYNVFNLQEVNFSEDNQYIALTKPGVMPGKSQNAGEQEDGHLQ